MWESSARVSGASVKRCIMIRERYVWHACSINAWKGAAREAVIVGRRRLFTSTGAATRQTAWAQSNSNKRVQRRAALLADALILEPRSHGQALQCLCQLPAVRWCWSLTRH